MSLRNDALKIRLNEFALIHKDKQKSSVKFTESLNDLRFRLVPQTFLAYLVVFC